MAITFLDIAQIRVTAGRGGRGCRSFQRAGRKRHRRPDGGDGGDGGHVILQASPAVVTLTDCAYRKQYRARPGAGGGSNGKRGATGEDCVVPVPAGTLVRDATTGELMRDLICAPESVMVARGGAGGRGNIASAIVTPGEPGEERLLDLELKLIADVGLVGLPNAGKSSLLRRISRATPRVAAFPFTTTSPVLGVATVPETGQTFTACDIPGLIAGAHAGKGLGLAFLRHAERTRLLVYVIDIAGTEGRHPWEDAQILQAELAAYSRGLADKPALLAANKADLPAAQRYLAELQQSLATMAIYPVSCLTGAGIPELVEAMWQGLQVTGDRGEVTGDR